MGSLERLKERSPKKEEEKSELLGAALSAKPQHATKQAAITTLSQKLEALAQRLGLSVPELLRSAESSIEFKEEFQEAMALSQQLAFLKRK